MITITTAGCRDAGMTRCSFPYCIVIYAWHHNDCHAVMLCELMKCNNDHYMYSLVCQPTNTCTDRNQTTTTSKFDCCDGFRTRSPDSSDYFSHYYQLYYLQVPSLPVGCPIGQFASLSVRDYRTHHYPLNNSLYNYY